MPLPIPTKLLFESRPRIAAGEISEVRLEAGSRCQLRCPACPTGRRETKDTPVGWGWLKPEDFGKFLEGHPAVRKVELSNYGEILLNPGLLEIVAIAKRFDVSLSAANGVNMNTATEESLAALSGFARVTMSIDGCSQETYVQYRLGGNFENVWRNAMRLVELRREAGLPLRDIVWQFIVFPHNEHEVEEAKRRAGEMGITFFPKMSWDGSHRRLADPARIARLLGAGEMDLADSISYLDGLFRRNNQDAGTCEQLWARPQINWDGKLLGCCVNYTHSFGNVFESGLEGTMNSAEYRRLVDVAAGRRLATGGEPCERCHVYKQTLARHYKWRLLPERILRRLRRA